MGAFGLHWVPRSSQPESRELGVGASIQIVLRLLVCDSARCAALRRLPLRTCFKIGGASGAFMDQAGRRGACWWHVQDVTWRSSAVYRDASGGADLFETRSQGRRHSEKASFSRRPPAEMLELASSPTMSATDSTSSTPLGGWTVLPSSSS